MTAGGDGDDFTDPRAKDEANIRWLLAAVLHHETDDDEGGPPAEGDRGRTGGTHSPPS